MPSPKSLHPCSPNICRPFIASLLAVEDAMLNFFIFTTMLICSPRWHNTLRAYTSLGYFSAVDNALKLKPDKSKWYYTALQNNNTSVFKHVGQASNKSDFEFRKSECGGHPLKGESRKKTPLHSKKSLFLLGSETRTSTARFPSSPHPLFLSYRFFANSPESHQSPIGIKANVVLEQMIQTLPLVQSLDSRKSSVPCRVHLDVLQILWFLTNPVLTHGIGESG